MVAQNWVFWVFFGTLSAFWLPIEWFYWFLLGPSQHFEPMDAKYAEQRIKSREPEAGWNESELLECIP